MTDFKKFNEIAELVGIVAIVASLVFVGMQMRQSQRIALAEVEGINAAASQAQYVLLDDDETAESVAHEFAAFLHARPGARRVWVEREAELRRTRAILEPESLTLYSEYVETIKADLDVMDRDEG